MVPLSDISRNDKSRLINHHSQKNGFTIMDQQILANFLLEQQTRARGQRRLQRQIQAALSEFYGQFDEQVLIESLSGSHYQ